MKKRGIGYGCMWYGIGNTGLPNPASAFVELLNDGSVIVLTGCADIGQGSDTLLAQIAAEELGVCIEDIKVTSADTGVTPEAGATSASRQTYISGNAVKIASANAKAVLKEEAVNHFGTTEDKLIFANRSISVKDEPEKTCSISDLVKVCRSKGKLTLGSGWFNPTTTGLDPKTGHGSPYATYAYATQIAEVEVDTDTGEVNVINIVAAHDVGKAIHPQNVEGQIEGGIALGVGYALMEEIVLDEGKILNDNFSTYLIPTAMDLPEVHSIIVECEEETGPFGAKGVGEPATIPTAPAIVNAIYNAIGVRIYDLPITPDKILKALDEKNNI